jgi:predicted metalloprotease with PDZ domain
MNRAIGFSLLVIAALSLPGVAAAETLTYELTPDFERGTIAVELNWQTGPRTQSVLGVSQSWGRIQSVTAMIRDLRLGSATARRDGASWVLSHGEGATVQVSYNVDPGHRKFDDWDYTHHPMTTRDFFHGMGNAFLMAPREFRAAPEDYEVILRWKLPAGYDAVCSWGAGRHIGDRIKAADLRHSVYLAGKLVQEVVQRGDRTVTVAMIDAFDFDAPAFAKLTKRIIDAECDFMVDRHFPDYVVTVIPVGAKLNRGESRLAGTGLYRSFALFLAPGSPLNDAVEHLFAHELFHYWNGRILPAKQPERQVFWFVEGMTDYYALRILYESRIWDARTYAKWINKHLREYARNPAINATNAEIERGYWSQRDTVGEVPYQRGLALGLRWHEMARSKGVRAGLDGWMISLVDRGREGYEVGNSELRSRAIHDLGNWFADEFDRYVTDARTVEVPPDSLGAEFAGKLTDVYEFQLGFDRQASLSERRVVGLSQSSAAAKAGLRARDELLAWNIQPDPDVKTSLTIKRDGRRKTISFYPRGEKQSVVQFRPR